MKQFLLFITVLVRLYLFIRIGYGLTMSALYPENYPVENLTWWIYFLVFSIWIDNVPNIEIPKVGGEEQ